MRCGITNGQFSAGRTHLNDDGRHRAFNPALPASAGGHRDLTARKLGRDEPGLRAHQTDDVHLDLVAGLNRRPFGGVQSFTRGEISD